MYRVLKMICHEYHSIILYFWFGEDLQKNSHRTDLDPEIRDLRQFGGYFFCRSSLSQRCRITLCHLRQIIFEYSLYT